MKELFNKISNLSQGVKASIAFFLASVITSGIAYITTPIFTRLLMASEYGEVSVFSTWTSIIGIIAMFRLSAGVFNNGMVDYPESRDEYSFSMLILSNIITFGVSVALIILYPHIQTVIEMDFSLLLLMCILFIVQPAYSFWTARQRYELKYKSTFFWTIFCTLFSTTVAIICVAMAEGNKSHAKIFGSEVSLIVIYIGFYIYLGLKSRFRINIGYWKEAIVFNLPLIPHYMSMYLLSSSDRVMISHLDSSSAAAYYSVAYSVAVVATIVWNAANASLIPYTYEKCKVKDYRSISAVTLPILTMFAAICILEIMFAPEVVKIMATSEYFDAVYVIPPIVGGVFFLVQYFLYANVIYYYKKPKFVMISSMTAASLNILLNYIFIPKFGYVAAGYTTLFSYFVQAVIDYLAMKRVIKEDIYNMKYIGLLSLGVTVIALISNLIYDALIIRIVAILTLCVVCWIRRRNIVDIFRHLKKR